jgi:hypothetical protein
MKAPAPGQRRSQALRSQVRWRAPHACEPKPRHRRTRLVLLRQPMPRPGLARDDTDRQRLYQSLRLTAAPAMDRDDDALSRPSKRKLRYR